MHTCACTTLFFFFFFAQRCTEALRSPLDLPPLAADSMLDALCVLVVVVLDDADALIVAVATV
jgi:hypothetical protein